MSSSFLHANIGHLLVWLNICSLKFYYGNYFAVSILRGVLFLIFQINCFSLSSIGPTVEKLSGPGRYMAIYGISAVAGNYRYLNYVLFRILSYNILLLSDEVVTVN